MTRVIGSKNLDNGDRYYYINNGVYQGYMLKQLGEDMFNEPPDPDFQKSGRSITRPFGDRPATAVTGSTRTE